VAEAVARRKNISTSSLAPQQLVDCSSKNCWGCNGGWPKYALDYVKTNGISDDDSYPYWGGQDACWYNATKMAVGHLNQTYNIPTRGKIYIKQSKQLK
jgi:hypothetical protein